MTISSGQTFVLNRVWYRGKMCISVVGTWKKDLADPLWVMTNLEARRSLQIYFTRMKITETYHDLKSLLGLTKLMNNQQVYMEKMVSLLLLIFTIGATCCMARQLLKMKLVELEECIPDLPSLKKLKRYSGLFVMLKQKGPLSEGQKAAVLQTALATFHNLMYPNVRFVLKLTANGTDIRYIRL